MQYDPLDYSPHMIKADQGLRRMRDLLLKRKYDDALGVVSEVITEMRLAKAAIQDNKERQR
jgi:hypothetical protein